MTDLMLAAVVSLGLVRLYLLVSQDGSQLAMRTFSDIIVTVTIWSLICAVAFTLMLFR